MLQSCSKELTGNEAELDPRLHGAMRSDANGAYEYETIRRVTRDAAGVWRTTRDIEMVRE